LLSSASGLAFPLPGYGQCQHWHFASHAHLVGSASTFR
jgi:hypothetical protein